jgi:hypothetical protein
MFTKLTDSFSRIWSTLGKPATDAPAGTSGQTPALDPDQREVQGPKIKKPTGGTAQGPTEDGDKFVQGPKVKRPTGHHEDNEDSFEVVQGPKVKRPTGLVDTPELDDDIKLA